MLFTFYIQGVLKLKKNSGAKRLKIRNPLAPNYIYIYMCVCVCVCVCVVMSPLNGRTAIKVDGGWVFNSVAKGLSCILALFLTTCFGSSYEPSSG